MREFPRTARLNHLIQEIVAEEIERLDDERLGFLTVVAAEVEPDLHRATVWYSSLPANGGEGSDDSDAAAAEVAEALEEARRGMQAAIARQARLKRTPELVFKPDPVLPQAERIESILRDLGPR